MKKKYLMALTIVPLLVGCGSSSKVDSANSKKDSTKSPEVATTSYKRVLAKDESYPSYYTDLEKIVLKDVMTKYFSINKKGIMSYGLEDVARAEGHGCEALTGAFVMTREALKYLANEYKKNPKPNETSSYDYEDGVLYRGGIKITMSGKDNTGGANNAMVNAMSYITGAKGANGFSHGPDFPFANRRNLLTYDENLKFNPREGIEAIFTSMKATYVKVDKDSKAETPATYEECKGTWGDCKETTVCDKSVKVTYKFIGIGKKFKDQSMRSKYVVDNYKDGLTLELVANPSKLCPSK